MVQSLFGRNIYKDGHDNFNIEVMNRMATFVKDGFWLIDERGIENVYCYSIS